MDGAAVSNLPIEAALALGAGSIVALDLMDTRPSPGAGQGVIGFLDKLSIAMSKRETDLELQLAALQNVPVMHIRLVPELPVPMWNFQHTENLIEQGYEITSRELDLLPEFNMFQSVVEESTGNY
ncbi:MAG: hypothetical protein WCP19_12170 [Chloroflexota bacterium]